MRNYNNNNNNNISYTLVRVTFMHTCTLGFISVCVCVWCVARARNVVLLRYVIIRVRARYDIIMFVFNKVVI